MKLRRLEMSAFFNGSWIYFYFLNGNPGNPLDVIRRFDENGLIQFLPSQKSLKEIWRYFLGIQFSTER